MLKPIVRLMLKGGIGYSEFSNTARSVFVDVATQDYGVRGRPTNASRVSAITGIPRKQVSMLRKEGLLMKWTPSMEASPLNTILYFWHYDPEFCDAPGRPKSLVAEGPGSFAARVGKYAGDIPVGAIRASLVRAGSASEDEHGRLLACDAFFLPTKFDDDYIRGMAYRLSNFGQTLVHNANLRQEPGATREEQLQKGRIERIVWSDHLTERDISRFRAWIHERAEAFTYEANHWVGEHEKAQEHWNVADRTTGVGIYYFEEDPPAASIDGQD